MPEALKKLIDCIALLPGIGEKTAARLAFFLMSADTKYIQDFRQQLIDVKEKIDCCPQCGAYKDQTLSQCQYCSNDSRDAHLVCVVEEYQDLLAIESTGSFRGRYHILGGAISPMRGLGPAQLRLKGLFDRLEGVYELIIATNPNFEGEATAMYIRDHLPITDIRLTRLSRGLPNAGYIEYADDMTIINALQGRQKY